MSSLQELITQITEFFPDFEWENGYESKDDPKKLDKIPDPENFDFFNNIIPDLI